MVNGLSRSQKKKKKKNTSTIKNVYIKCFCHDKFSMVIYMVVLMCLEIDVLRCWCCGRASRPTANSSIDLLLWACRKNCCCTYNIYEITIIYIKSSRRWVRWRVIKLGCNCDSKHLTKYFNVVQEVHWLSMRKKPISLCHVNDVIISACANRVSRQIIQ